MIVKRTFRGNAKLLLVLGREHGSARRGFEIAAGHAGFVIVCALPGFPGGVVVFPGLEVPPSLTVMSELPLLW